MYWSIRGFGRASAIGLCMYLTVFSALHMHLRFCDRNRPASVPNKAGSSQTRTRVSANGQQIGNDARQKSPVSQAYHQCLSTNLMKPSIPRPEDVQVEPHCMDCIPLHCICLWTHPGRTINHLPRAADPSSLPPNLP